MFPGSYGDKIASCGDNKTGICTHRYDEIEPKPCKLTVDEFLHIEFRSVFVEKNSICENQSWTTFALFILDTEPILS